MLMDCEGKVLDSSEGSEPFAYLHSGREYRARVGKSLGR